MTTMQGYINAHCEAARNDPYYRSPFGGGYDDDEYYDEPIAITAATQRFRQATPPWLMDGLQQYLDLGTSENGDIEPRGSDEDFGHLAASAQPGEQASFIEIVSDALYIPPAAKVGRTALNGDCFVVQTSFSFGVSAGKTAAVKPRLTLNLVEIGGESRSDIIDAARAKGKGEAQLREEDLADDSGDLPSIIRVKSGIRKPKTDPQIGDTVVREQKNGTWQMPRYPGKAAGGLLKVCLSPVLDPRVKRVKLAQAK